MNPIATTSPLSYLTPQDVQVLKSQYKNELIRLIRRYGLFALLMIYACFRAFSRITKSNHTDIADMQWAYIIFTLFFSVSIGAFVCRDYWKGARLIKRDLDIGQKQLVVFTTRKYEDFIFKKCLLFYPDKDNVYLCIDAASFAQIEEGEVLSLERTPLSGSIIVLKNDRIQIPDATEFKYK